MSLVGNARSRPDLVKQVVAKLRTEGVKGVLPGGNESARHARPSARRRRYWSETLDYNSRLDEFQAVLLRVWLRHVDEANAARRRVAGWWW